MGILSSELLLIDMDEEILIDEVVRVQLVLWTILEYLVSISGTIHSSLLQISCEVRVHITLRVLDPLNVCLGWDPLLKLWMVDSIVRLLTVYGQALFPAIRSQASISSDQVHLILVVLLLLLSIDSVSRELHLQ